MSGAASRQEWRYCILSEVLPQFGMVSAINKSNFCSYKRHRCPALAPVDEQAPAASSDNSELSPDSWRATCCSRRSFCRAQVACTASPHTNRATGSQPRSEQWPDTLPPPCALGVLPRPHGLAHSPASCSPLTLDRLRRTAVIAADEGLHDIDIDRTDLSDPALNADLDKPKTLLPHSDVEPSSMMLQPVGESEPSRKNSAAV